MREIDAIIEGMAASTPRQPYIMSTPSDRPYELARAETDNWRINTPFEPHERHLQYMTFLWRDPSTTICRLDIFPEDPPARPATTVPTNDAPKKKIKFDAYKNRKLLSSQAVASGGQAADETKQVEVKTEVEVAQVVEAKPQDNRVKTTEVQSPTSSSVDARNSLVTDSRASLKSSPEVVTAVSLPAKHGIQTASLSASKGVPTAEAHIQEKTSESIIQPVTTPPAGLARTRKEDGVIERLNAAAVTQRPKSASHKSAKPGTEGKESSVLWLMDEYSSSANFPLPSRMPTPPTEHDNGGLGGLKVSLPELSAAPLIHVRLATDHSKKGSAEHAGIDQSSSQIKAVKEPAPELVPGKRLPSEKPAKKPSAVAKSADDVSRRISNAAATGPKASRQVDTKQDSSLTKPKKRIVRLKFSRSRAKTVLSILKLKANPQPKLGTNVVAPRGDIESITPTASTKAAIKTSSAVKVSSKPAASPSLPASRIKPEADSPSVRLEKRSRDADKAVPESAKKRMKLGEAESTARLTPSRPIKQDVNTPRKDVKQLSSTPNVTSETPKASESVDAKPSVGQASPGSVKTNKPLQIWMTESTKLQNLGKTLKRQAAGTYEASQKEAKNAEKATMLFKLYALERIESVLCFILAFSAISRGQSPTHSWIPHWRSLLPMATENTHASRDFPELNGLCALLIAVCFSNLGNIYADLKRLNIPSAEEPAQQLSDVLRYLHYAQKHGAEAERLLPKKTLAERYRQTNKICESLPIGMSLKPVAAVKVALTFMKEWAAQEKVEWKQHLEQHACSQFET